MESELLLRKLKFVLENLEKLKKIVINEDYISFEASQRICEKIIETTIKINTKLLEKEKYM